MGGSRQEGNNFTTDQQMGRRSLQMGQRSLHMGHPPGQFLKPNSGGSKIRLISIKSGSAVIQKQRTIHKQTNTKSTENRKQTLRRDTDQHKHIPEGIPISPSRFSGVRDGRVSQPMHQMKDPQREDPPTHILTQDR